MNATCEKTILAITDHRLPAACKAIAGVIPRKHENEILRHAKFARNRDGWSVRATDLEIEVFVHCGMTGPSGMTPALIPADMIAAIAKSKVSVCLESEDGKASSLGLTVNTGDSSEFPDYLEDTTMTSAVRLTVNQVRYVARHVAVAVDAESSRYALGNVMFDWKDGYLHVIATDGWRMHVAKLPRQEKFEGFMVSARALSLFVKACDALGRKMSPDVSICFADKNDDSIGLVSLTASFGDLTVSVSCRPLLGMFPRWADVIPSDTRTFLSGDAAEMVEQVKSAAKALGSFDNGVTLKDGKLSKNGPNGSYEAAVIDCDCEATATKFNPKFWVEALAACGQEFIASKQEKDGSAVVFVGESEGMGLTAVVMPLKAD